MRQTCSRIARSRFQKLGAGPSGLNYRLEHILWHTPVTHHKQAVDTKNVFSHVNDDATKFNLNIDAI